MNKSRMITNDNYKGAVTKTVSANFDFNRKFFEVA
jgi:hypothetical protein